MHIIHTSCSLTAPTCRKRNTGGMHTGGRLRIGGKGPNTAGGEIAECLNAFCAQHNIKLHPDDQNTLALDWKNAGWEKHLDALIDTRHRQV